MAEILLTVALSTIEQTGICRSRTMIHLNSCIEYTSPRPGFELTTLLVIGTDCIGSYKFDYHTITTMTTLPDVSWTKKKGYIMAMITY